MMNTSFSEDVCTIPVTAPVTLMYRDIAAPGFRQKPEGERLAAPGMTTGQLDDLLTRVRNEAVAQTEKRLKGDYEARSEREAVQIRNAIEAFQAERKDYFSRVEAEIVHLALSIAAKILHREAQVDTMLVAALVRVAVEKLHDGSKVAVRIPPSDAIQWRQFFAHPLNGSTVEVIEDSNLAPKDCILETDLGSANFSIEGQLKEVEQGFCDLLAQRPDAQRAAAQNVNSQNVISQNMTAQDMIAKGAPAK